MGKVKGMVIMRESEGPVPKEGEVKLDGEISLVRLRGEENDGSGRAQAAEDKV